MQQRLALSFAGCLLLAAFNLSHRIEAGRDSSATPTPESAPRIEKIEFDREQVFAPCPVSQQAIESACGDTAVRVKTTVVNPGGEQLSYHYTISGGRVVGRGERVEWDLSGVVPGVYTISVAIDPSAAPVTRTVEVKN
jgi:hypothetical protein